MDTLKGYLDHTQIDLYNLKRGALPFYLLNQWKKRYDTDYLFLEPETRVLATNMFVTNDYKRFELNQLIKRIDPDIVWTMENYKSFPAEPNYTKIDASGVHLNALWIKNELVKNRFIHKVPYGIQVDNICYRYIPPNKKKTNLTKNEIGDLNFLSNKWIKCTNVKAEKRVVKNMVKPGGMCSCLNIPNTTKFWDFCSDHKAMSVVINQPLKVAKQMDAGKTAVAIDLNINEDLEIKDIFKIKKNCRNERKLFLKQSNKIIDPIACNLPLNDWFNLYHHDEMKIKLKNYYPTIREKEIKIITSRADDINNINIRSMLKIIKFLNKDQIQNVLMGLKWINFNSRTVCLTKKDKKPDKVKNLRPIQISPISFKVAEQSRKHLKEWINQNTDKRCFAFKEKSSIPDLLKTWKKLL